MVAVHRNELPVLPTTSALEGPPAVRFVAWSVTCGVLGGATTARLVLPWMEAAPAAFVSVHPIVSGPVDEATNVIEFVPPDGTPAAPPALVIAALPADQEYVIPARTVTEAVYVSPLVTLPLTAFGTEMVGGAGAGTTVMVTEAAAVLSPAWLVAAQLTERGPAAPGAVGEIEVVPDPVVAGTEAPPTCQA